MIEKRQVFYAKRVDSLLVRKRYGIEVQYFPLTEKDRVVHSHCVGYTALQLADREHVQYGC